MDKNEIKELIEIVDKSSFTVLALKKGDMELVLKKRLNEEQGVTSTHIFPGSTVSMQDTTIEDNVDQPQQEKTNDSVAQPQQEKSTDSAAQQQEKTANPEPQQSSTNTMSIQAPLVGVFYRSSSPEAEPFVTVGQTVKKGDIVCIIEAMKILNEIKSPASGTITKIHANNNDIVEFNQILMEIGE